MDSFRTQVTMGTMNFDHLKDSFTSLVASAEPTVLPAFFMWIDHRVAEYKCKGYMYAGHPNSRYEGSSWYNAEMSRREQRSSYGMSPDTTVQTEALELTKSPEKPNSEKPEAHQQYSSHDYYKNASKISYDDISYPKTQPAYSNHHSPVYGSEASGIINLSVKSSHNEEAKTTTAPSSPLKLALKVPTMYTASSPAKPPASSQTSLPPLKSEPSKPAGSFSSLRTLLEARKGSDLPTSTATVCASPLKSSDAESNASSPGPENLKGEKKNECPYCGKDFQYRSSFRRHIKIHQGVYTHICANCHRKFTRKEHFDRHKCNRKPNIPNRSASRVELTPEAMLPSNKLPQPKVAYPPTLDEHQISSMMAAATYSPAKNLTETFMAYQQPPALAESVKAEDEAMHTAAVCNESRRKKAQPRKLIVDDGAASAQGYIDDDLLKEYESPVHTPVTHEAAGSEGAPSSPEDLSMKHEDEPQRATDMTQPQQQVKPIEIIPDTISTTTGTYQIEQVEDADKCIKVTKQSNYLKLRKDAQMVDGKLQFLCPHCKMIFHRSSNYSRHMRLHRGVFSYICPSCNRGFYRREHFKKHKCARRAMSRIGERKSKLEMAAAAAAAGGAVTSDGEKENLSDSFSDDGGPEAGVDLGPVEDDYESSEEGDLVVDESAGMEVDEEEEDLASMNSPLPPPAAVDA